MGLLKSFLLAILGIECVVCKICGQFLFQAWLMVPDGSDLNKKI